MIIWHGAHDATDNATGCAVMMEAMRILSALDTKMNRTVDDYDRVVPADLMQAAAIVASLAWHAANRDEIFPRKALPEPVLTSAKGAP